MRLRIFQILLFVGLLLSTFQVWSPKSIRLTTQITAKHPITIQIFYTENDLEGFSQPKSTKKQVMYGTTDFSIDIPAQSLTSLRMDFDSNPGEVKFTPPKIYGTTQIDLKSYKLHFSPDIENTNVSNSQEHIIASTKKDPYVYWEGLSVESKKNINFCNIQTSTFNYIIFYFPMASFCFNNIIFIQYYNKYKKNATRLYELKQLQNYLI